MPADGARVFNDDFIEIYNPSPMPVSIGGFYLTDNLLEPVLHRIATNSYMKSQSLFSRQGKNPLVMHGCSIQTLILTRNNQLLTADLEEVDTILYGPQRTDISQGRTTDGAPQLPTLPSQHPVSSIL